MADRYWVGGTGNWSDNTNHWSATDGGAPGAAVPTSADNVFFTAASNATAYTVTMNGTTACKDMTWALPSGSGVPTLTIAAGQSISIYGSVVLVVGMLWTSGTSTMTFTGSAAGKTITTAGVNIGNPITIGGAGGDWTLLDSLTIDSARTLTVSNGTLNTNAQTVTTGFFASISGTRTLTLDGSTINITGTSGTPWNVSTGGTLTFTATGSTINFNGGAAGVSLTLTMGALTYGAINITGAGVWALGGNVTSPAFSYTSTTNKTDSLTFNNGAVISSVGSLTLAGNSTVNRAFIKSNTLGTQRSILVPSGATVTLTNVDFQDIASAGTYGTWTGTSLGDCLGNSGITFDASTTQTWTSTASNASWSDVTRWTSRVPLPQDDVELGAQAAAGSANPDMPRMGRNINASNYNRTLGFSFTSNTIFGNITLGASGTYSGTNALTLAGRGAHTITSNGKTFPQAVTVAAFGGTYTAQDAAGGASTLTTSVGTFNGGAFDMSFVQYVTSAGATIAGTSAATWNVAGGNGTSPWSVSASSVLTNFFATIKFTAAVTTTVTFGGGGKTYSNFYWSSTSATGILTITGANTFADFKIDGTTARTVTFPSSTTTTMGSFTRSNQGTAVLTIGSSTPGTVHTLSKAGGGNVILDYLNISDSVAIGGNWYAGRNSTNTTPLTNVGWFFRTLAGMLLRRARRWLPL